MKVFPKIGFAGVALLFFGLSAQVGFAQDESLREQADRFAAGFYGAGGGRTNFIRFCNGIKTSVRNMREQDPDGYAYALKKCAEVLSADNDLPVTPGGGAGGGGTGGGGTGGGGTGGGGGGGKGGGGGTVKPTPAPQPPAKPEFDIPKFFCDVRDKIKLLDAIGILKNRWWGYSNKLVELLGRYPQGTPGYIALMATWQNARGQYLGLIELQYEVSQIPVIDCTQHGSTGGGYVPPGAAVGGAGVLSYAKSFVTLDGGLALTQYKFEDGFDSRHTAAVVGLRAGADWNIGGGWTLGPMAGFYTQLGRADKQGLQTGINWYGTAEAKIATDRFLGEIRRGLYTWASGGFAFGEIENRTATLNQSVVATGWTGALGVNYQLAPDYKVGLTYRHTHLGPKFVDQLRTGVAADSDQVFISFQRDFKPQ